ncbi:TonB-dependent receptor [Flavobacterium suzhouense]|uniref:TonB-dependent receptor n=1 Tax=Flavobacterium suzhouense TaxID=1529638 RepID=A0ABW5NST8_9FLAO
MLKLLQKLANKALIIVVLQTYNSFAQENQHLISGVITSGTDGHPVTNVKIIIKDSPISVFTDENGKFEIREALIFPVYLTLSHGDYKDKEVEILNSDQQLAVYLTPISTVLNEVQITSRRRREEVQDIPIPIAVIGASKIEQSGSFNVNRVKELVPSVQLYSSNPRNTTLNVRGIGSTFGLTNDGIDPGVGFYIDGVYHARPAATTLDFVDIERIEVLRGPQGTLFGKNTTAGAFNITSKRPTFNPTAVAEVSYGNYGYIQAKTSLNGGLLENIAGRLSFSGTQRNGVIENVTTGQGVNDLNNIGVKGQLLYILNENAELLLSADYASQRPNGYAQAIAGVVRTQRADYRQFDQIVADLGYSLPYKSAFDRKVDQDTAWRSDNDLGGISVNYEHTIGNGKLVSTTAWRFWDWNPSNDRDYTGLPVLTKSQAPSKHNQLSQEVRYAGNFSEKLSGVIGLYAIEQDLKTSPYHIEESGAAQWRFSQSTTSELWATPGLFDGYGIRTKSRLQSTSAAIFGQLDWSITSKLHVLPGLRYNYDKKKVNYNRETYGGLETTDPELLALKKLVYSDQKFSTEVSDDNFSGQLTIQYRFSEKANAYATYAQSFKPVGVNLGGLPTADGQPMLNLATVKPENVQHFEAGFKSTPFNNTRLNLTIYKTIIEDYQTLVQTAELGVNRGYLSNADQVSVKGVELEANSQFAKHFSANLSISFTEGKYDSFKNAPVPLEETGGTQAFKDISGGRLPGISKWSGAIGAEYTTDAKFFSEQGLFFAAIDTYFRSDFSSSPSPSKYLNIGGYALLNGRIGFRVSKGLSAYIWGRNILNRNYYEQLLPAAGNAGQYAAVLGDPATYGITLKYALN